MCDHDIHSVGLRSRRLVTKVVMKASDTIKVKVLNGCCQKPQTTGCILHVREIHML